MQELGLVDAVGTSAQVFVPFFEKERLNDYLKLAADLRAGGCRVELYPEPKKLAKQLKYAGTRGFQVAVIAGQTELDAQTVQLKNLAARTSEEISVADGVGELVAAIQKIVA